MPIPAGVWKFVAFALLIAGLVFMIKLYGDTRYDVGLTKGEANKQKEIDDLTLKLKEQESQYAKNLGGLQSDRIRMEIELKQELLAALQKKPVVLKETTEVWKYVTAQADQKCELPVGAVWLLNRSPSAEQAPGTPGVAGSPPGDVDAPSGIALSTATSIVAQNFAECVERGDIIHLWQKWYLTNKTAYEAFLGRWKAQFP